MRLQLLFGGSEPKWRKKVGVWLRALLRRGAEDILHHLEHQMAFHF